MQNYLMELLINNCNPLQNARQKAHYFNGGMNAGFSFFVNTVFVLEQYFNLYNELYKLKIEEVALNMATFILELPIRVAPEQVKGLNKRFDCARHVYNNTLSDINKLYNQMCNSKEYKTLVDELNKCDKDKQADERKRIWNQINALRKDWGFSKSGFEQILNKHRYYYKALIDSTTGQKLALRLWQAWESFLYKNGKTVHYKKYGDINSLEGKSNTTGPRLVNNILIWGKKKYPVVIKTQYEHDALLGKICYDRVVRRAVRGKYKFYLQVIIDGEFPQKANRQLGSGRVGVDIGVSTIAMVSKNQAILKELPHSVELYKEEKALLQQAMDRSRRATNPNNYNADGTVKSGRKKWHCSKRYNKLRMQLKELQRKCKAIRKYKSYCLLNEFIALGDTFLIEDMVFKTMQERKEVEVSQSDGKISIEHHKNQGSNIEKYAPSDFVNMLNHRLESMKGTLIEIDTYSVKASQYNHINNTYIKKELTERWNIINGKPIQRDLYSAFLIMHVKKNKKIIDRKQCVADYNKFVKLHDAVILELKQNEHNPSSMGI